MHLVSNLHVAIVFSLGHLLLEPLFLIYPVYPNKSNVCNIQLHYPKDIQYPLITQKTMCKILSIVLLKIITIHTRSLGGGNGTPLQYSCLENPMDGGAWWATVHGVTKSRTQLSDFTFTFHSHALEKEMAIHSSILAWRIPGTGEPGGLPSMGSHRVGHG